MNTATNVMANTAEQAALKTVGHLIGGEHVSSTANGDQRSQPVYNPATGRASKRVALASRTTVQAAIAAAAAAFPEWRNTPPLKRARVMFKLKQLLETHANQICALITDEHGKVLSDAMGELQRGVENVEYAAGAPELLKGEFSKNVGPAIDSWSEFQPLGVAAGITPFNFPCMVPLWMWPMAVVCGNTFVLKPSERDPSCVLRIAELALEAGLPPGVLNVVNGDKEAVDTLLTDPRVQAISFVGSTPIAEYIYATGCAHGKRVQALGGAKNHAVVMPDADFDNAVNALMGAAYGSCGERCMAIPVVVAVGDDTAEAVVSRLKTELSKLKVGPGTQAGIDMGPLITQEHCAKVRGYVDLGVKEGAQLVVDGRGLKVAGHEGGSFLGGCLFDRVTPAMKIYRDEIFGPVLAVVRVPTLAAAMELIDAHEYGNGTCLFTRDGEAARYFTDHIRIGMVGVNVPLPVPVAYHSFGGWKRSLFGDLGAYGPDGVRFYTKRKTITQRWPSAGVREGAVFSFPSNR
jgi:malonate-semialdehyde dehydrogenase (acetylating)/methylmalonate-semialdehyde dehydrogenase